MTWRIWWFELILQTHFGSNQNLWHVYWTGFNTWELYRTSNLTSLLLLSSFTWSLWFYIQQRVSNWRTLKVFRDHKTVRKLEGKQHKEPVTWKYLVFSIWNGSRSLKWRPGCVSLAKRRSSQRGRSVFWQTNVRWRCSRPERDILTGNH